MQKRKYKYLYQLICTSIILVIVPSLLFYNVFWKKSFQEINHINTEYYNNVLTAFYGTFTNEVSEFKEWVVSFAINSRTSQVESGVFFHGTDKMERQPYYYGEALGILKQYSQEMGYTNMGIYYYDKDCVLVNGNKFTSERYMQDGLRVDEDKKTRLREFFSIEKYKNRNVVLAPLYDGEGKSEALLIGICEVLGKDKEKAMVFYQLSYDDINFFNISVRDIRQEKYYVLDNDTRDILFSIGATTDDYISLQSSLTEEYIEEPIYGIYEGNSEYFVERNMVLDVTFLVDVSGDTVQKNVVHFYHDMKLFFVYIILIMFVIVLFTVYANYRPMHRLLKQIKHKGKNEFDAILSVYEDQNDLLTEQRMMIMDLLMNHLLYGIPISWRYIQKLGVSSKVSNYCVFVIKEHVLKAAEIEMVTSEVEETFGVLLFATDLTGEKSTVIIAFMEHDKSEAIKAWLEAWCMACLTGEYELRMGHVVDRVDDIQKSFRDCLDIKEGIDSPVADDNDIENQTVSERVRNRAEINEKLKEEVLNYLDENYTDSDLSQTVLADYFQISVYSLSKMFNNQIGMGFSKYVNSKRIEHAKELLITTELSVKDIACLVGVPDDNYFSRIFRKYTGVSPLEYRNDNK